MAKAGDIFLYVILGYVLPSFTYGSHMVAEELKTNPLGMKAGGGMVFGFGIDGFRDKSQQLD